MQIKNLEEILEKDGIVFLIYGGFLTQPIVAGLTTALENEIKNSELTLSASTNLFTIFIELAQNMMNYSKTKKSDKIDEFDSKGLIIVGVDEDKKEYYVLSRNIIDEQDKDKIQQRLNEIEGLDKDALRALYRERRKSGRDKHNKGAGIGFIEIARRCDKIIYKIDNCTDKKCYFTIKAMIKLK